MDLQIDWRTRVKYLLDYEKFADCRFLVGTEPRSCGQSLCFGCKLCFGSPQIISGHKLILAMASPEFERMFYGSNGWSENKTDTIRITDVQPDTFRAMMEYIYSDKISIDSFDKACELYYVAKKYILPHVVEQCTNYLWDDLSPENACRAYELAKLYEDEELMQRCLEMISTETRKVLVDPSFVDIELKTLLLIFQQDQLNIDSEIELFNALERYATKRGYVPQPKTPAVDVMDSQDEQENSSEVVMESADPQVDVKSMQEGINEHVEGVQILNDNAGEREGTSRAAVECAHVVIDAEQENKVLGQMFIKEAIKRIRFLTLSPFEFAEGPARSKLLTKEEVLTIFMNISSANAHDYPMPPGLCTLKYKRKTPNRRY